MRREDQKRLLRQWLEPRNKNKIYSHAVRYAAVFRAEPEDLVQWTFEILWKRAAFGPNEYVVFLAQDVMQGLAANRRRSLDHKRTRLFSHEPREKEVDEPDVDNLDTDQNKVDEVVDADAERNRTPNPEKALLEKERVETYRKFLEELKAGLTPIELGIVGEGEDDNYDTTELQKKLKCTRDQIYEARRTIKEKAVKLRDRWTAGGRALPGFPGRTKDRKS
jgi:DNA-directed RNA polymerase specialized sigma24 family protein